MTEDIRPRLRKPFRLGVQRKSDYKPFASVGLAKDGGVFVAPHDIRGLGWSYGRVRESAPIPEEQVDSSVRPKLHYHRSGIVRPTLSADGTPALALREAHFRPIHEINRSQVFSIVCSRTWEYATAPGDRRTDVSSFEPKWPWGVAFSLALIWIEEGDSLSLVLEELQPFGLVSLDPTRFLIDLSGYGDRFILLGTVSVSHDPTGDSMPGTSVIALDDRNVPHTERFFGLWTETVRNPKIWVQEDSEILSSNELRRLDRARVREWAHEELHQYLYGSSSER